MAGRPKDGLDYAAWSVDTFDGDKKIDKLLDAHGWKGFGVYFFLCLRAYKTHGYYFEWGYDDCATTARKMGGGIVSSTVEEAVRFCLQIGLFDAGLFDRWGILTSKGIQRRFWAAIRERRVRSAYKEYWLLSQNEAEGLVLTDLSGNLSPANSDLSPANEDMQPANAPKRKGKQKKEKESKQKERESGGAPHSRPDWAPLWEDVFAYGISRGWGERDCRRFFDCYAASGWLDSKGCQVRNWKQKMIFWEKDNRANEDRPTTKSHPSPISSIDPADAAKKMENMRRMLAHMKAKEKEETTDDSD